MADDNNQRFDILLTGAAQPGVEPALAAARLGELFRIPAERAAQLLQGKAQRVKAGVDRATALRYRDALQRTGAVFAIRAASGAESSASTTASSAAATEAGSTATTQPVARAITPGSAASLPAATPTSTPAPAEAARPTSLTLAEPGMPVLTAAERPVVPAVHIDDSALTIAPPFAAVGDDRPQPPPPDTSHLSLRAEGELLDASERQQSAAPVQPPAFSLAEPGALLETLTIERAPVVAPIDHLDLAPLGAPLLADDERPPATPAPAPGESTDWRLAPVKASFNIPSR